MRRWRVLSGLRGLTCRFCRSDKAFTPHPARLAAGYLTFFRLAGHNGAIYLVTPGLRNHFMEAKCLIQHVRIKAGGGYNSQLAATIKMTHRAANQRLRRIQAGFVSPLWNGGLEMIISKRPFTSEKTLLAKTSPSTPLAASVARLASTAGAETSHKVRRIFGEWRAAQRQLKAHPRHSRHPALYLSCAGLTSRAATGYRHPDRRG